MPPAAGNHPVPPDELAPLGGSSLTGYWRANDGGTYYLRQIDSTLWWLGLSDDGAFYPGLRFCNVFHAAIAGLTIIGDWCDVPRGAARHRGTITLTFVNGPPEVLLQNTATGDDFTATRWWRIAGSPWPSVVAEDVFTRTRKNIRHGHILGFGGAYETLDENLHVLRNTSTVFGAISAGDEHAVRPVTVNYPPDNSVSYGEFICLNKSPLFGGFSPGDPDGDATFDIQIDHVQVHQRQPRFFSGIEYEEDGVLGKMTSPVEAEIIMFGRTPSCDDDDEVKESAPPLLPGWAEPEGSSPLFNGTPIRIDPSASGGGADGDLGGQLRYHDLVRVSGVLVFDIGHTDTKPDKLEIHPVYAVDKITATSTTDLSGAWADDVGNTYHLRHDPGDGSVWFAALSPLGEAAFAQVFRGRLNVAPRVIEALAAGPREVPDHPPLAVSLTGETVAIPLGYGFAPSFASTGARLGETGPLALDLGATEIGDRDVPALAEGSFRLIKLYDK